MALTGLTPLRKGEEGFEGMGPPGGRLGLGRDIPRQAGSDLPLQHPNQPWIEREGLLARQDAGSNSR